MYAKQKRSIESYQRVQAFLTAYPAPSPYDYSEAKAVLDAVVAQLKDHSVAQLTGRNLGRAERQRQLVLLKRLRDRHLRPIVTIARANRAELPGIDTAIQMPSPAMGILNQLRAAASLRDVAEKYPPVFVKYGRPADFLDQLSAAVTAVEEATTLQARNIGDGAGAKEGIRQELRRGRQAVGMLDAIVKVAFEGNEVVLRAWQIAKRVKGVPSSAGTSDVVVAPTLVAPQQQAQPSAA